MTITQESCLAVSKAILKTGPLVDRATYKAHVPEHVSRGGKILFGSSSKALKAQAGVAAENDARWHLDRCLSTSENWRLLHNVLIPDPWSSSPCQIDHVAINRLCDVVVFETKSTRGGCVMNKETGAWLKFFNGRPQPMASPIEQNRRHIKCLRELLKHGPMPRRIGVEIKPTFHNWILVEPGAQVPREFEDALLVQRDAFETTLNRWRETGGIGGLLKLMSAAELDKIYMFLKYYTKAEAEPNGVTELKEKPAESVPGPEPVAVPEPIAAAPIVAEASNGQTCSACKATLTNAEAWFCRVKRKGKAQRYLCKGCQKIHG